MNIALVAHDGRKKELMEWVGYNALKLADHKLYATGTTGKLIKRVPLLREVTLDDGDGFPYKEDYVSYPLENNVNCLLSGPLGGDQQIGAMIAEGKVDALVFFCDNLIMQGHQNDVSALTRLASLYNIPFATNRTTADMILTSPLFGNPDYERIIPKCIEDYKNRKI